MPETPPIDMKRMAGIAQMTSWRGGGWLEIAEAVVTDRDQDWQTAMEARTTALRQAREALFIMRDFSRMTWSEFEAHYGELRGEREAGEYLLSIVESALATIEAALTEGKHE